MAPKRYVYTSLRDDLVLRPLFETLQWKKELQKYKHILA